MSTTRPAQVVKRMQTATRTDTASSGVGGAGGVGGVGGVMQVTEPSIRSMFSDDESSTMTNTLTKATTLDGYNSDDSFESVGDGDAFPQDVDAANGRVVGITPEEFDEFMESLGLSAGNRVDQRESLYKLVMLQVAACKHFFPVVTVIRIMDSLSEDSLTQARAAICFFTRLVDLHNFDGIMRRLTSEAQHEVVQRLGWLNVINPLKPSYDFILPTKYLDNKLVVLMLVEISANDSGDNINDDVRSDVPLVSIYGSTSRVMSESFSATFRFSFCEVGERTKVVNWPVRRDMLKRTLLGTKPLDRSIFTIISMYREMEKAGALERGPVETQYASFEKGLHSRQAKLRAASRAGSEGVQGSSSLPAPPASSPQL